MPDTVRIAFTASAAPVAREALGALVGRYGQAPIEGSDVVVAIGGDGIMIDSLHRVLALQDVVSPPPVFGMHRGTTGFLMNDYGEDGLPERITTAASSTIFPLRMRATELGGDHAHEALACNEVALRRLGGQSARLRISVDGEIRMPELMGDGVLIATPAGSTAYNRSARGPIIPLDGNLLALTPICPLRPLHWSGALLSHLATVRVDVLDAALRPVSVTADQREFLPVRAVEVSEARDRPLRLLFDCGHALDERVVRAQFGADPTERPVFARQAHHVSDRLPRDPRDSPLDRDERGGARGPRSALSQLRSPWGGPCMEVVTPSRHRRSVDLRASMEARAAAAWSIESAATCPASRPLMPRDIPRCPRPFTPPDRKTRGCRSAAAGSHAIP